MKKEDMTFLNQLVKSLEDAELKLEEAHQTGNSEKFNEVKRLMIQIQKQITETLK